MSLMDQLRQNNKSKLKSAKSKRNRKKSAKFEEKMQAAEPANDIMSSLKMALSRRAMSMNGKMKPKTKAPKKEASVAGSDSGDEEGIPLPDDAGGSGSEGEWSDDE